MTENGVAHSHEEEENELLTFYKHHLGESRSRSTAINYSFLQEQSQDLTDLEDPFTEDEIKQVIFQARSDNAPGPDGFTGAFFNKCWEIIQEDVVLAINQVANHDTQSLWLLNSAYIALLPKRSEALRVGDYRLISLIHAFGKLFSKLLANRLAPKLQQMISKNQSAFIKGRNI